jgi:hypothetical protein
VETEPQDAGARYPKQGKEEAGTRISYAPRQGATPEGELAALASVYRFVLERHERKKAARPERAANDTEVGPARGEQDPSSDGA